jgi:hypothetical protein
MKRGQQNPTGGVFHILGLQCVGVRVSGELAENKNKQWSVVEHLQFWHRKDVATVYCGA